MSMKFWKLWQGIKRKKWKNKGNVHISFTEETTYTALFKAYCVWCFLIELKHWGFFSPLFFGKVRSCFMFSPHHSPKAWKSWLVFFFFFIFPDKNVSFWKSAWWTPATFLLLGGICNCFQLLRDPLKLVSRLYHYTLTDNTGVILSKIVKHWAKYPHKHKRQQLKTVLIQHRKE